MASRAAKGTTGGFSFDFLSSDDRAPFPESNHTSHSTELCQDTDSERRPLVWIENVTELLLDRSQEEIVFDEIPWPSNDKSDDDDTVANEALHTLKCLAPVRRVDHHSSSFVDQRETTGINLGFESQIDTWKNADIEPGVYEGGMKVWECSIDLVRYLATQEIRLDPNQFAIELGCGHGLPACYLLRESLRASRRADFNDDEAFKIIFTDYNDYVLKDVTISNMFINIVQQVSNKTIKGSDADLKRVGESVLLGAGDWMNLSRQLTNADAGDLPLPKDGHFDLILAAETLYSEITARETAQWFSRHLKPNSGVGLVASKRYYFGVGGGVDTFRMTAQSLDLLVETVKIYDNGSSNIRELLRVQKV